MIGLGTNLPWRGQAGPELLGRAVAALHAEGLAVARLSSVWRTPAWPPGSEQPDYHNAVVELEPASDTPEALFEVLRRVEQGFGRERRERWGPRTLDLDILSFGDLSGDFGPVTLPHPRLRERAFVLAPLAEVNPDWRHPVSGEAAASLLARLPDRASAIRIGPLSRA